MTLFDDLTKQQLKELLVKCWMTHDGSWFYNCACELGIEGANKLNKAAIKNLSVIEMQRIKKAMGWEAVLKLWGRYISPLRILSLSKT